MRQTNPLWPKYQYLGDKEVGKDNDPYGENKHKPEKDKTSEKTIYNKTFAEKMNIPNRYSNY